MLINHKYYVVGISVIQIRPAFWICDNLQGVSLKEITFDHC